MSQKNAELFVKLMDYISKHGLTQGDVARLLRVSQNTFSTWKKNGGIPCNKKNLDRVNSLLEINDSHDDNSVNIQGNNFYGDSSRRDTLIKKILAADGMCANCKTTAISLIMNEE